MNRAYLNQEDSQNQQEMASISIFQELESTFDAENYFLEATCSQSPRALDRSLVRCEQSFFTRLNVSPSCIEQDESFQDLLTTSKTFQSESDDSYMLYASSQQSDESIENKMNVDYNLENDLYVTFDQSELFLMQVEQSWTKKIVNSTESEPEHLPLVQPQLPSDVSSALGTKSDLTMKVCCKSVYNYLMKPFASKIAKKFVKKHLGPTEKSTMPISNTNVNSINRNNQLKGKKIIQNSATVQNFTNENRALEPIKIYSNHPAKQIHRNAIRSAPIQQTLYNYPVNTFNNHLSPIRQPSNFANCGDLVYYFV